MQSATQPEQPQGPEGTELPQPTGGPAEAPRTDLMVSKETIERLKTSVFGFDRLQTLCSGTQHIADG